MKRTLVLNAGYEPMQLVSWQRAIGLLFAAKAEMVAEHSDVVRTVTKEFTLPSVIRLKRYVRIVKRFGFATCTRKNVLLRDRNQCQYCGVVCRSTAITVDHIIPKSKGGGSTWENLVAACHTCNRRKGSRSVKEIGMKLRRVPKRPAWRDLVEDQTQPSEWSSYLDYVS